MATGAAAPLSRREGRKFAFTVGAAFLVLAAIAFWRGGSSVPIVLTALGTTLLIAGLVVPGRLGPVQRGWMALAHAISRVTTPILMAVVYYLTVFPIGVVMRVFGRNPLVHPEIEGGFWVQRPSDRRRSDLERQF